MVVTTLLKRSFQTSGRACDRVGGWGPGGAGSNSVRWGARACSLWRSCCKGPGVAGVRARWGGVRKMTGWVVTVVASNAVCNPLLQNAMCARRPRAALAVFPISSYPFSIDERSALGACRSLHSTLMQRHWPPFAWVCFAMCVGVMGTALASPLYPLYQAHWGLQPSHITGIYVAYMFGALASLLFLGRETHAALQATAVTACAGHFTNNTPNCLHGRGTLTAAGAPTKPVRPPGPKSTPFDPTPASPHFSGNHRHAGRSKMTFSIKWLPP